MSKQTAVEYLIQYMMDNQYFVGNDLVDVFDQAKAMEREQIEDAYSKGQETPYEYSESQDVNWYDGKYYYNETYKELEQ